MIAAPEVVCVDTSEAAIEAARGKGLDAHLADIQELPFALCLVVRTDAKRAPNLHPSHLIGRERARPDMA